MLKQRADAWAAGRARYRLPGWEVVCLTALFVLGAAWRFTDLRAPGHLADREYTSAIFSRAFFFQANPEVESWRRDNAQTAMERQPVLEPPVTDYIVSLLFRAVGHEDIRLARLLTGSFWLIGGLFMYQFARELLGLAEAVLATGYYLLLPMSVLISRSYQPDSLMMMLFLISLVCVWRYFRQPTLARVLAAGVMMGLTLLVRPLVLFGLLAAIGALVVWKLRTGERIEVHHLILLGLISLALPVAYYGNGIAVAGFMRWKLSDSFRPFLFARWQFWTGWMRNAIGVVGQGALAAALLGFPLLQQSAARAFITGLAGGYLVFGLAFTYHIHTHPYYQIQLIPIIAICLAPALHRLLDELGRLRGKWWLAPVAAALLVNLYLGHKEVQAALVATKVEEPAVAREVGALVHHSARTVFVARHYGVPLQYLGEFTGAAWPVRIEDPFYRWPGERERTVEERLAALDFVPEYFVITALDQARQRHHDLLDYLDVHCHPLAQTEAYWIYHQCQLPSLHSSITRRPMVRLSAGWPARAKA